MKAAEQYFPVVLFIMLNKVVLTFESVDEILKCDHLEKTYLAVFVMIPIFLKELYIVKFLRLTVFEIHCKKVWPFIWKLLSSTFL